MSIVIKLVTAYSLFFVEQLQPLLVHLFTLQTGYSVGVLAEPDRNLNTFAADFGSPALGAGCQVPVPGAGSQVPGVGIGLRTKDE